MKWKILILLHCFIFSCLHAEIYELDSMGDLERYVDDDTFVLFDLDHTIFESTTAWGHIGVFNYELEKDKQLGIEFASTIRRIYQPWVESQKACPVQCVESITPSIVRNLQKRNIMMMGLTHRQIVVSLPTLDQLATLNIDFDSSPVYHEQVDINTFISPARYLEGILFVSDYNDKGDILKHFFNLIRIKPKKVVFIDDGMRNLISVEKAMSSINAKYIGLHYRLREHAHKNWSPQVAHVQKTLYNTILSDEAALYLLGEHGRYSN